MPRKVWLGLAFRQDSGGKQAVTHAKEQRTPRRAHVKTPNPSRIEGKTFIRETFKVWEVGRTFLARSVGQHACIAEAPLYVSLFSVCGFVAECLVSRSVHAYAHVQAPKTLIWLTVPLTHAACVRECRTMGTQTNQ